MNARTIILRGLTRAFLQHAIVTIVLAAIGVYAMVVTFGWWISLACYAVFGVQQLVNVAYFNAADPCEPLPWLRPLGDTTCSLGD